MRWDNFEQCGGLRGNLRAETEQFPSRSAVLPHVPERGNATYDDPLFLASIGSPSYCLIFDDDMDDDLMDADRAGNQKEHHWIEP